MFLYLRVVPRSKKNEIEIVKKNLYKVKVKAPAEQNLANKAIIKLMANYFKISEKQIKIVKGVKSRNKILEIKQITKQID